MPSVKSKRRDPKALSHQQAMSGDHSGTANNALGSMQKLLPQGFDKLIQKLIRVVLLGRPLRMNRFIADYIDVELTKRSLAEIETGCYLKKTLRPDLYPTESCRLLMKTGLQDSAYDQFLGGPILENVLELPALDRYRELDQPGVKLDLGPGNDQFMEGELEELELNAPALDRYRELPTEPVLGMDDFLQGSVSTRGVCVPALDRYREFEPPSIPCGESELKCPDGVSSSDCVLDSECCDDDDVNEPDATTYDEELCDDIDVSVPSSFVMRVCDRPDHGLECQCSVCRFFKTATYFFFHPEEDGTNESEFDEPSPGSLEQRDSLQGVALRAPDWRAMVRGPSGPDEFTKGEIPEHTPDTPALDRYRELSATDLANRAANAIRGQFTVGGVPDYEVRAPALDRYRAQAKLIDNIVGVDDKRVGVDGKRPLVGAANEPKRLIVRVDTDTFTSGPISDHQLELPALDRYREMSLEKGAVHATGCKCAFCAGRDPVYGQEAAKRPIDTDQFNRGPVPEYEPFGPALDRYREVSVDVPTIPVKKIATFFNAGSSLAGRQSQPTDTDQFTRGPIPENDPTGMALDRYREAPTDGSSSGKWDAGTSNAGSHAGRLASNDADQFTRGPIPENEPTGTALDRYRQADGSTSWDAGRQASNDTDQFTRGPVPEIEPTGTALDRYRVAPTDGSGWDAGKSSKAGSQAGRQASNDTDQFTKGPIPENDPTGTALDRYRDGTTSGAPGTDAFTRGPISVHELESPALDRYRVLP